MSVCVVDGCDQPIRIKKRGLCNAHYIAFRTGKPLTTKRVPFGQTFARFWDNLVHQPSGCWEWRTCVGTTRYGVLSVNGRTTRATKVAWELARGPVPAGSLLLHTCDNPPCCRPDHLYLGTYGDNARDAAVRGRYRTKVTTEQVAEMRQLYAQGVASIYKLARMFSLSESQVQRTVCGARRRYDQGPTRVRVRPVRAKVQTSWAYYPACPDCEWPGSAPEFPPTTRVEAAARSRAHLRDSHGYEDAA